ncbi:hypothetical protein [Salinispora tropica]|uniref:Uncharacterized protein n=1 Tax=Salinispora tropica (strain ATCC BAA-916 / DSM 44818 / JCM 13857 / NBRC 105044 / CNB-440) TaxID=369723 RepID=A4X2A2_SALTO|nr:hypothetical protein [Salinispora tropica]ABP53002.1 hypothetical protein Strop_0518 [Salinispora tropica CNB-440]
MSGASGDYLEAIGTAELGETTPGEEPDSGLLVRHARELVERLHTEKAIDLLDKELDQQNITFGRRDLGMHADGRRSEYAKMADSYRGLVEHEFRMERPPTWDHILLMEVYKVLGKEDGSVGLGDVIQVAAVAIRIWLVQQDRAYGRRPE